MKWFKCFSSKSDVVGDEVLCQDNCYGRSIICKIDRIYYRNRGGSKLKYYRLVFELGGVMRSINVYYKSCKKVNLG
jgi:hypothetical protein